MNDAGCPVRPEWIVSADFTIEGAYAAARQLLASAPERPTAVFAASDEMAIGTILAARDFGLRIPDDLSVMGIDGHDLGKVLGLTTIDQDAKGGQGGALAVRTLLGAINNGLVLEPADTEHPPTRLVVRTSTAVPRPGTS